MNTEITITSKSGTYKITTAQAKEYSQENEKFCYVVDTYGLFNNQDRLIAKIEKALIFLAS